MGNSWNVGPWCVSKCHYLMLYAYVTLACWRETTPFFRNICCCGKAAVNVMKRAELVVSTVSHDTVLYRRLSKTSIIHLKQCIINIVCIHSAFPLCKSCCLDNLLHPGVTWHPGTRLCRWQVPSSTSVGHEHTSLDRERACAGFDHLG